MQKIEGIVVFMLALGWGCSAGQTAGTEDTGMAEIALAAPPADVTCLRIKLDGARSVDQRFDLPPDRSSTFLLTGLPLGVDTFTGFAYAMACNAVDTASVPTWLSDPVPVTIRAGIVADVSLVLHRNTGRARVSVGFDSDGGTDEQESGVSDGNVEVPPFVVTTTCPVTIDSTLVAGSTIDDVSEHQSPVPAVPVGAFADCPVLRTFARPIATIMLSILKGSTVDDTGYVGAMRVTAEHQGCNGPHEEVLETVDVTSQVTVNGSSATFLLRAQETCCCFTGWGYQTNPGSLPGAKMHWQVTLQD